MSLKAFFARCPFILMLLATPLLVGSQCAVFFSSGGNSNGKDEEKEEQVIVVASGHFGVAPVAGIDYISGSVSGVTGSDGEFQYEVDQPLQFSIGDIPLGRAVSGKSVITAQDLVPEDDTAFANVASQLVSVMTADYPFTGVLVDARTAQDKSAKSM